MDESFDRADTGMIRGVAAMYGGRPLLIVGQNSRQLAAELRAAGSSAVALEDDPDSSRVATQQNGAEAQFEAVVWFYDTGDGNDLISRIGKTSDTILLVPTSSPDALGLRPNLVGRLNEEGFFPDYQADVSRIKPGALKLVRKQETIGTLLPAVETAFARVNSDVRGLERALRTRMSQLEAADRHIAGLEEKLLRLKEAQREIKQLKQEKQALRKSPERKLGQVLLAPYLLPRKLLQEARKRYWSIPEGPGYTSPSAYQKWFEGHRISANEVTAMRAEAATFSYQPLISVITPVFNTPAEWLSTAVASVEDQIYDRWELLLIDDASTSIETLEAVKTAIARDARIRLIQRTKNGGIAAASNDGLSEARGEWIGLLDHDDVLEPDALFQTAKLLQSSPDADLIYSDEDKLTGAGLDSPLIKPDWSPDFFLSYCYIAHFATFRLALAREVGNFRPGFDGAQDYDLFLRMTERTQRIYHISRVLYHWRRSATSTAENIRRKPGGLEAGKRALTEHLERLGESADVEVHWPTHTYRVRRDMPRAEKISIIIPTRDQLDLLSRCIDSLQKTSYENYEVIIVDNDSEAEETRQYLAKTHLRVVRFRGPFNFSAMNNYAVEQTDSPWLLFLNNDVEVIEPDWLSAMAEHVQRPQVGAVGARLLYADDTIQHAGVVLGVGGMADHAFRGFPADNPGVARQLQITRNYSAVTGACLLTRRDLFRQVGGFDEEHLPVSFSDVDLCLKLRRAGYLIVYTPFAKLYHHEFATRQRAYEPMESEVIRQRWSDVLQRDPYYNPNLSRKNADFSLGI